MMNIIGKIVNTKGLKGEVKVLSSSDFKNIRFQKGKEVFLKNKEQYTKLVIEKESEYKNFTILKFEGLNSINDVEVLKNQNLYGEVLNREHLEEGEYFFSDLETLKVYEGEVRIGKVIEVLDYGSKTYLKINKTNEKKIMFPFNHEFITKIDLENGIIYIKSIEGLLDD